MNRKNNRQFQGSAQRMEQAMLELMDGTPFEKITVRCICEKAGVNRSTFYAHYTDIYDMIERMESNLQKNLMKDYPVSGAVVPLSQESFLPFLRFLHRHADFYRVALKTRRSFPLKQGFEPLWDGVIKPLSHRAGIVSEAEMMYYFVGFQAGFTTILKRWVDQGCVECEEEIARVIENIVPAIWRNARHEGCP